MLRHFAGLILLIITVHLAWDANTDPTLAGYKLYYGTASRTYLAPVDVGNVTEYQLPNVDETQPMFFAVTAYDQWRNESAFSNEIQATTQQLTKATYTINSVYILTITDGNVTKVVFRNLPTLEGIDQ